MSDATWPPMIWIGGAPGAGKSTLGRALAHAADLPLHPIDRWTWVHAGRLPAGPPLAEVLARGAEEAAQSFADGARERLDLVLADVAARDLGDVPALVEGPQLFPELAGPLPRGFAVWLLPDPEQTRRAREARLAAVDDPAARASIEGLVARDAVIAALVRDQADAAGLPVVEVGADPDRADPDWADPDWAAVRAAVEDALSPALAAAPRLPAGEPLAAQRRFENEAAARQIELWTAAERIGTDPVFPFACECGRSGCAETWSGTVAGYRSGPPLRHGADRPTGA
ncbi:MAG TPA: hypothetical protein VK020_05570 [Microlunatus sp.]|nr:hypothetical protein [Microlunatus sp.]